MFFRYRFPSRRVPIFTSVSHPQRVRKRCITVVFILYQASCGVLSHDSYNIIYLRGTFFVIRIVRDVREPVDQETLDHQTGDRQAAVDQHEQDEEVRHDAEQEKACRK